MYKLNQVVLAPVEQGATTLEHDLHRSWAMVVEDQRP